MILALRISLAVVLLLFTVIVFSLLRKQKLNLKYTLLWLFSDLIMIVLVIFPDLIGLVAGLLGVASIPNTVFMIAGGMGLLILLSLTVIVSTVTNRLYRLSQSVALLEERLRRLEESTEQQSDK